LKFSFKDGCAVQPDKSTGSQPDERFAIVDDVTLVRFLSWDEFESLKQLNPRLIEMKAGDINYLTETPVKS
jgi:hypothetical protein